MTNIATNVDYALVFEDISTLNRIYARVDSKPLLDPQRFLLIESNGGFRVIRGLRTGLYYMADQISNSFGNTVHTKFAVAEPRERKVTDWVWV